MKRQQRLIRAATKTASLLEHAKRELELAGWFKDDPDSMYAGMIGPEVLKHVQLFSEEGHSGMSASIVRALLHKLLDFQPLTPIGNPMDSGCYNDVSGYGNGATPLYQCTRDSRIFSEDHGKSWYRMVDVPRKVTENGNTFMITDTKNVPLPEWEAEKFPKEAAVTQSLQKIAYNLRKLAMPKPSRMGPQLRGSQLEQRISFLSFELGFTKIPTIKEVENLSFDMPGDRGALAQSRELMILLRDKKEQLGGG